MFLGMIPNHRLPVSIRQVYKARNKETNEVVALKRVRMDNEKEGFPITAIREIKILKVLNHKNIVRLKEIVTSEASEYNHGKGSIYMVMEFSDHDLTGLVDGGQRFTPPQIKCYMKQLLEGLMYCHKNKILHRDIKGSNLLINNQGQLQLADFGLARPFETDQHRQYTNRVITLWYRPPELLLGANVYGPSIDMWSTGCIFAELLLRRPILPGRNEYEQISLIFKMLGTPNDKTWPKVSSYPYYEMVTQQDPRAYQSRFKEKFSGLDPKAQDLLSKLLAMDPSQRISAKDALDHDYFWSEPMPARPEDLPKYPPSHEFTAKKRRQAASSQPQQQQHQHQSQPQQQQAHHYHTQQHYNSSQYPPQQHQSQQHQSQHQPQQQQQFYGQRGGAATSYGPGGPASKRPRDASGGGGFYDARTLPPGGRVLAHRMHSIRVGWAWGSVVVCTG